MLKSEKLGGCLRGQKAGKGLSPAAKAVRIFEKVYEEVEEDKFPGTSQKQQRKVRNSIFGKRKIFSFRTTDGVLPGTDSGKIEVNRPE